MIHHDVSKLFVIVCSFIIVSFNPLTGKAPHISGEMGLYEVDFTAEFSDTELRFNEIDGYDVITINNGSVTSQLGSPVLPVRNFMVAIPPKTQAIRVVARSRNSIEIPGSFHVLPGQPPEKTSVRGSHLRTEPDDEIYDSRFPYPGRFASLDHQSDLAGQEIAWVTVYPLQYLPAEKKLSLSSSIDVTIICSGTGNSLNRFEEQYNHFTQQQREDYEEMVKNLVVNPAEVEIDPVPGYVPTSLPSGRYDHVIITTVDFASAFLPLMNWHTKKGVRDTVITPGWIYHNYTGPGDTLKIRQFIMDATANWGTLYFLMGGENSIVPFAYRDYGDGSTPSDQYYSDYDDDWTHEVYVGRASIESVDQVTTFVDKVLKYERDPPTVDYPLNVLLIGMDVDEDTPCEELKETVHGYIPSRFNVTTVYDSDTGNHRTAAIAALNAGQNLVNHSDHSDWNYMGTGDFWHWWGIYSSNVDQLVNDDRMSIVVSDGCWPNSMDENDCIAEHFVIYNTYKAGIAFTGNTRDGYYWSGIPESLSGQLDRNWWQGVFQNGQTSLGKAIVWSKHQFANGNQDRRHCEWTFNLLGDPAMPIWLDTPGSMDVSHPSSVPRGSQDFTIQVSDNESFLEDALVCVMKGNEVYEVGSTGVDGEVTVTINPATQGTIVVTVTAQDYRPYEGVCKVSPPHQKTAIE